MKSGNLILLIIPILLIVLLFSSQRKRARQATTMRDQVRPGVQVMTTSGLYATVIEVDGDVIVLESAPGQRQRWARAAVGRVVDASSATEPPASALQDSQGTRDESARSIDASRDRDNDRKDDGGDIPGMTRH